MTQPKGQPFVNAARAQTMLRDFDRLRKAVRDHDPFAADAAFDRCERWIDQLQPNKGGRGMTDLGVLSNLAADGSWAVKDVSDLGSDIYAGRYGGNFVAAFRSNDILPDHLKRRLMADAEFTCALVNEYRGGWLVEVDHKDHHEG